MQESNNPFQGNTLMVRQREDPGAPIPTSTSFVLHGFTMWLGNVKEEEERKVQALTEEVNILRKRAIDVNLLTIDYRRYVESIRESFDANFQILQEKNKFGKMEIISLLEQHKEFDALMKGEIKGVASDFYEFSKTMNTIKILQDEESHQIIVKIKNLQEQFQNIKFFQNKLSHQKIQTFQHQILPVFQLAQQNLQHHEVSTKNCNIALDQSIKNTATQFQNMQQKINSFLSQVKTWRESLTQRQKNLDNMLQGKIGREGEEREERREVRKAVPPVKSFDTPPMSPDANMLSDMIPSPQTDFPSNSKPSLADITFSSKNSSQRDRSHRDGSFRDAQQRDRSYSPRAYQKVQASKINLGPPNFPVLSHEQFQNLMKHKGAQLIRLG